MGDIKKRVVAIQGKSISSNNPANDDVLTWDNENEYWAGKPGGLRKEHFISDGYWTAPPNVNQIIVFGMGGGTGGKSGNAGNYGDAVSVGGDSGQGGNGAFMSSTILFVDPNTTYAITIGSGGNGASGGPGYGDFGENGENTSFGNKYNWIGAKTDNVAFDSPGAGGFAGSPAVSSFATNGMPNVAGLLEAGLFGNYGNSVLMANGAGAGAGGGGASNAGISGMGNGGGGGDDHSDGEFSLNGRAGGNANNNSGNGGGGGGGGGWDGTTAGNGGDSGNGGSGFLTIIY